MNTYLATEDMRKIEKLRTSGLADGLPEEKFHAVYASGQAMAKKDGYGKGFAGLSDAQLKTYFELARLGIETYERSLQDYPEGNPEYASEHQGELMNRNLELKS